MYNKATTILEALLNIDQFNVAKKLGYVETTTNSLSYELALSAVGVLNGLSKQKDEKSVQIFISIAALLWEHRLVEFDGLKEILILLLSRIGYSPSSIILDNGYTIDDGLFSPLNSIVSQIETSLNQQKYEIKIKDKTFLLTYFQKQIWNLIDQSKVVGISAPTSAGKSFILLLRAIVMLMEDNCDIIYVVPTLSLVNQVTEDFIKALKRFQYSDYEVLNSYNPDFINDNHKIYILTQEKAIAAFSKSKTPFSQNTMLIIDEIQNIERVSSENSDMRSKILYDAITEFRYLDNVNKIIISGPRIESIDILGSKLFGVSDSQKIITSVSPVLNITYSIEKIKNIYYFKQYCSLFDNPRTIEIKNSANIVGHNKKTYTDDFIRYLVSFVKSLGANTKNIIFSPHPKQARESAIAIAGAMRKINSEKIISLSTYLKQTVRENYKLSETVEYGVAYHHGKLPSHVRKVIEKATTEKLIDNVVCTTTLMQGINLPAQNVIIRNPHLYIKKTDSSAELSSYEMANLRGRAGRLLKDFVGRTFVLDENEFLAVEEEYEQTTLFENTYKELDTSYEGKYKSNETGIINAINKGTTSNLLPKDYGFIVIYIRQSVLRHGDKALARLKDVGIELPIEQFKKIQLQMQNLQVGKEICIRNRYWDPLVLDKLFQDNDLPNVPTSVQEKGISSKLRAVLKYLRDSEDYKTFFESHIKKEYRSGKKLSILCSLAEKWLKEKPLSVILSEDYYDDPDNIDDTIGVLQNTISFDIPLLLRPIYEMNYKENMFLTFIETGAFKPLTRKMIEIGIPRETAIFLNNTYLGQLPHSVDDNLYTLIQSEIKKIKGQLPFWIQVQLEFIT